MITKFPQTLQVTASQTFPEFSARPGSSCRGRWALAGPRPQPGAAAPIKARRRLNVSYSLNSLKGGYIGDCIGLYRV